jgi:hypothetical protein
VLSRIVLSAEYRSFGWSFLREARYLLRNKTLYVLIDSPDDLAYAQENKKRLLQCCNFHMWQLGVSREELRLDLRLYEPTLAVTKEVEVPDEPEVVKP